MLMSFDLETLDYDKIEIPGIFGRKPPKNHVCNCLCGEQVQLTAQMFNIQQQGCNPEEHTLTTEYWGECDVCGRIFDIKIGQREYI